MAILDPIVKAFFQASGQDAMGLMVKTVRCAFAKNVPIGTDVFAIVTWGRVEVGSEDFVEIFAGTQLPISYNFRVFYLCAS